MVQRVSIVLPVTNNGRRQLTETRFTSSMCERHERCELMKCAPPLAGDTPSTDFPPGDTTWKFALAPPSYLNRNH